MITLADVSEFQGDIEAPAYLRSGHTCLIVRAHNGWRPDRMWPVRRDYLRKYQFDCIGWYQYLVAGRDAGAQAHDFISAVGPLHPNEFACLDLEEGAGDQTGRAHIWFETVDGHYGKPSTLYSGEWFGRTNIGGWARWSGRPRWVAAYQGSPPPDPHELWQNTDRGFFAGIGGGANDGSIFNGTAKDFARIFAHHTGPTPAPHSPAPKPPPKPVPAPAPKPAPPAPAPSEIDAALNAAYNGIVDLKRLLERK